jgi:DNA polymerase III delta prime subunit
VKFFKINSSVFNIEISLLGLYFYPKISINKWIIKTIEINNIEETNDSLWDRIEIENDWHYDIIEINNQIDDEINKLKLTKDNINNVYNEIISLKNADNLWENKINLLKKYIFEFKKNI